MSLNHQTEIIERLKQRLPLLAINILPFNGKESLLNAQFSPAIFVMHGGLTVEDHSNNRGAAIILGVKTHIYIINKYSQIQSDSTAISGILTQVIENLITFKPTGCNFPVKIDGAVQAPQNYSDSKINRTVLIQPLTFKGETTLKGIM